MTAMALGCTGGAAANAAPAGLVCHRFSTDDLPADERVAFVRDVWGRAQRQIDIEPLSGGPYRSAGVAWALPGLQICRRTSTPVRTERRKTHLADGAEDLFVLVRAGHGTATQLGREVPLRVGDAVLISSADEGVTAFPVDSEILVVPAPRRLLAPLVRDIEQAFMRPVQQPAALRLIATYVDLLEDARSTDGAAPAEVDLQRMIVAHVLDLLALAVGATRDTAELARARGVRAARLSAIRADILANLDQVRLSAKLMAERHGVCERYVYALFEDSGVSFGAFVTEERLKRARAMLLDPACSGKRICEIALDVGFGDLSHFNRSFRRRYGTTPGSVRRGGQ